MKSEGRWRMLAALLALGLFALVGRIATTQAWAPLDQGAFQYYQSHPSPALLAVVRWLTRTGDVIGYTLAGCYAYYLYRRARYRLPAFLLMIFGCSVLVRSTKWFYGRSRPALDAIPEVAGYAYPSGHTLFSTCFYGYLGYTWLRQGRSRRVGYLLLSWPLVVAWTRVVLGWHWVTDVVGGFLLGSAWLLTCISLLFRPRPQPSTGQEG